jgi:hypothetical protein
VCAGQTPLKVHFLFVISTEQASTVFHKSNILTWLLLGTQVLDGFFVKYLATVVALVVYAVPLYLRQGGAGATAQGGAGEVAQDYIQAMRLLQNTSR